LLRQLGKPGTFPHIGATTNFAPCAQFSPLQKASVLRIARGFSRGIMQSWLGAAAVRRGRVDGHSSHAVLQRALPI
jgi:hypothetical protein